MSAIYRAVLLIESTDATDFLAIKKIVKSTVRRIESQTDGATIQLAGPSEDVRTYDLHKLADETFVHGEECQGCQEPSTELRQTDDGVDLCPPCMEETIKDTADFIAANPEEATEMGLVDDAD